MDRPAEKSTVALVELELALWFDPDPEPEPEPDRESQLPAEAASAGEGGCALPDRRMLGVLIGSARVGVLSSDLR